MKLKEKLACASLGEYISQRRMALSLSQAEVARRLNKHPTYVSKIEKDRFIPPIKALANLCDALDLSLPALLVIIPDAAKGVTSEVFGKPPNGISPTEIGFLTSFRRLPPKHKKIILNIIRSLIDEFQGS